MTRSILFPLLALALTAQPPQPPNPPPANQPRPEGTTRKTAQEQGAADADVALTRQIRKEIHDTKGLGTHARNVKVITKGGKVTLRGAVPTPEEKAQVEAIARKLAGDANVTSELRVKAPRHGHDAPKDHPIP